MIPREHGHCSACGRTAERFSPEGPWYHVEQPSCYADPDVTDWRSARFLVDGTEQLLDALRDARTPG